MLLKDPHFSSVSGSRSRRVALPLGLMGAGASVCYPAQAVAVVKVAAGFLYIYFLNVALKAAPLTTTSVA